ncbi:MAG TPA: ABC transporter ATP-binding protein, partial [Coriobacteriia bacterium]|nr:ABC transporter ATP-binding protein [Coriobacteriia bacterium]
DVTVAPGIDLGAFDTSELEAATGSDGSSTNIQNIDFSQLYGLQPLLDYLPESWFDEAHDKAMAMDSALKEQSAMMLTGGFYRELGRDMAGMEIAYIIRIGLIMLLITALSGAASILVGYLSARIGAGVARDLRQSIYKKVVGFSHTEFDRFSTASLITRSTNDVAVIQVMITMGIRMICYAPIMGAGGVFMAVNKSVSMSWIIGVAVVVLIGIMLVLLAVVMPKFKIMQKLIDRLNLVARESLNGLMVIRAFSRTGFEEERFDVANKELTAINLFVNRAMVFLMPVMMIFMNGLTVLIIWVGAHYVAESQMQVGDMMAYMQYVMQIIMSFMFIAMLFIFIPRASVSAKRINEVLETEPQIVDPRKPLQLEEDKRGLVEFKDVSFHYEGAKENALCNISFTAKPGQTTAFIGSTGAGKSTIINLIVRFYDVTEGEVRVAGVDVRHLKQEDLRGCIGYVPQKSVLMSGTVASNISYGVDEMTPEEMEKIAEVAQALEFIDESDERFEREIAQGGASVSGGQRQRLSIARALAVRPDIYLFDDSFSALDFKTDTALRKALATYTKDGTLIIVAQRISTIMDADQIFVIDQGRVVGSGKHHELLESCEAYFEIASSQLSESELVNSLRMSTADRGGE